MELAAVFTNNMVLQQGIPVPIWGTAKAGNTVTVRFAGQEAQVVTEDDGRWEVRLNPLVASNEPRTMTVESLGSASVSLSNVLVGEVWVCSGQSNMEWQVANTNDSESELPAAKFPNIRLFTVPQRSVEQPESTIPGAAWQVCTPATIPQFSAVAYFFGRELHRHLAVPVGLINTSWGGTVAEAWTSRESLLAEPLVREIVEKKDRDLPRYDECFKLWEGEMRTFEERTADVQNIGLSNGWADLPDPVGDWSDMDLPGTWQSRGLNFSGILWFRKIVDLPVAWAGQDLQVSVGATDKSDITYFNNEKIGSVTMRERPDAWAFQRTYTVPGRLVKAGRNVIAVRVHSDKYNGGMTGPAVVMRLECPAIPDAAPLPLSGLWRYAIESNFGFLQIPAPPMGPGNPNTPYGLFNGMIAPLVPFAVRGAIWYQGESNTDRTRQYRALFPTLIRDWRSAWGQADFGFYFVQLANYMAIRPMPSESPWAELREAQTMTLALPHTGMAVTHDIGETEDIHPRNKQDVGLRLALNALHQTYGQKEVIPCGPLFRCAQREDNTFRIFFSNIGGGLECRGQALQGFAIAGEDRQFVWADARIDGESVVVFSPTVPEPLAVRYAWADNPVCNLFNASGLPASSFRTDDWLATN